MALGGSSPIGAVLRRFLVAGSTSKTMSLGRFTGLVVSGGKGSGVYCMVSRSRVSRTYVFKYLA